MLRFTRSALSSGKKLVGEYRDFCRAARSVNLPYVGLWASSPSGSSYGRWSPASGTIRRSVGPRLGGSCEGKRLPLHWPHRHQTLGKFNQIGRRITGDRTGRSNSRAVGWEFLHVCIDDASRVPFSKIMKSERGRCAVAFLKAAVADYKSLGITVLRV